MSDSSSDSDGDPRAMRSTQSQMKSLFATDKRSAQLGSTSLKYETEKKSTPAGNSTTVACQTPVILYRGETTIGPCVAVVLVTGGSSGQVALIDRERRPQCRVRIDVNMQLLPNPQDGLYATLFDPSIQQHWTLMFKTQLDCLQLVVAAHTLQYYNMLAESPVPPYMDVQEGNGRPAIKKNDVAYVSYTMWLVKRVGQAYSVGKLIEDVPMDGPKLVRVGTNTIPQGAEECLVGCSAGQRRICFMAPKKTKVSGIANPEIGTTDSIVMFMTVSSVEKKSDGLFGDEGGDHSGDSSDSDNSDGLLKSKKRSNRKGKKSGEMVLRSSEPRESSPQPQQQQQQPATQQQLPDTNTLLQTMLLQTLQTQNQPRQQESASRGTVDESAIHRLHNQLSSLYEKMDRLDIEGKLQQNNAAIERIVKKAVGKMPVNDVDIEDMAKDRDQLLAKIEHLKGRVEEMTDSYHKALETMGRHTDETASLKNDLVIERETSQRRIKELEEHRRLERVDMEVRHRKALETTKEQSYDEGKEDGYKKGYDAGMVDAMSNAGAMSQDDMKEMLHKKEQEIVELESKLSQHQSKRYEERREHADQIASLNNLIKRLEDRDVKKKDAVQERVSVDTKMLRRVMNATYASIESQFYATEATTIAVEDALSMVLLSVKSETRHAVEDVKREAAMFADAVSKREKKSRPRDPDDFSYYDDEKDKEEAEDDDGEPRMVSDTKAHADEVTAYRGTDNDNIRPDADQLPSTAGDEAYQEMRREIEEYTRQRELEQAGGEVAADTHLRGDVQTAFPVDEKDATAETGIVGASSSSPGGLPPPPPPQWAPPPVPPVVANGHEDPAVGQGEASDEQQNEDDQQKRSWDDLVAQETFSNIPHTKTVANYDHEEEEEEKDYSSSAIPVTSPPPPPPQRNTFMDDDDDDDSPVAPPPKRSGGPVPKKAPPKRAPPSDDEEDW